MTDDLPVITQDNYEVDNTFGVQAFYLQQTALVSKSLDEDAVEVKKRVFARHEETKESENRKLYSKG